MASGCSDPGEATFVKPDTSPVAETRGVAWVAKTDNGRTVEIKPLEPLQLAPADEHEYFVNKDPGAGFCVDAQTGQVVWRAMVCDNASCSGRRNGQAHVFVHPVDEPPLTTDGRIDHAEWDRIAIAHFYSLKCPTCGEKKQLRQFDPPEVAAQRQLLLEQLDAARTARREARSSGQPLPAGVRSPSDIMRDLDALPKLFLAPP